MSDLLVLVYFIYVLFVLAFGAIFGYGWKTYMQSIMWSISAQMTLALVILYAEKYETGGINLVIVYMVVSLNAFFIFGTVLGFVVERMWCGLCALGAATSYAIDCVLHDMSWGE